MHPALKLLLVALCVGCADQSGSTYSTASPGHAVKTSSGVAEALASPEGVLLWRDIPYAQAPIGDLRWRAPRPLPPQTGAIAPGDGTVACLQQANPVGGMGPSEGIVGREDCLYLDVRAPLKLTPEPRPVMVWVHGGGNTSGNKGYYDFSTLVSSQDVIVVTLNYRLGPLGWFTHPGIQPGQEGLDGASNFGTLDIIQALRWIRDNIAAFGGDQGNITLFGESAGGHNIYAMLASPLAEGLFHKAIVQSGYVTSASLADAHNPGHRNSRIARSSWQLGESLLAHSDLEQLDAGQLRSLPGRLLMERYYALDSLGYVPLTTADGVVIPREGMAAALADPENAKGVPVISGTNRDEVTLWLAVHRYFVDASYPLSPLFPPRLRLRDPQLYRYWVGVRSQAWKLRSVDEILGALEAAGYSQLYAYRFDWDDQASSFFADFPTLLGAAHGIDVSFVTGDYRYGPVTDYIYPDGAQRDQMQRTMMQAWASFARDGVPGTPGRTNWPPYFTTSRHYLHLDTDKNLRLTNETQTLGALLAQVANADVLDERQKCILVWDSLTKVGDPDYPGYRAWEMGRCATVDPDVEQRAINTRLRRKFGSETVF